MTVYSAQFICDDPAEDADEFIARSREVTAKTIEELIERGVLTSWEPGEESLRSRVDRQYRLHVTLTYPAELGPSFDPEQSYKQDLEV